jgi:hypothetical protein
MYQVFLIPQLFNTAGERLTSLEQTILVTLPISPQEGMEIILKSVIYTIKKISINVEDQTVRITATATL